VKKILALCIALSSGFAQAATANICTQYLADYSGATAINDNSSDGNIATGNFIAPEYQNIHAYISNSGVPQNRVVTRLFLHDQDCNMADDDDLNLAIEVVPCDAVNTKDFTTVMRESMSSPLLGGGTGVIYNVDPTMVMNSYVTVSNNFVAAVQSNPAYRICAARNSMTATVSADNYYCDSVVTDVEIDVPPVQLSNNLDIIDLSAARCNIQIPHHLKLGEEIVVTNEKVLDGSANITTFGFARVVCDIDTSDNTAKIFIRQNDEPDVINCDPDQIDGTFDSNVVRGCNQLCFWGQELHCPEVELAWGNQGGCQYVVGSGFLGFEADVSSQSNYQGDAVFRCGLGGAWVLIENSDSCDD
jgi:hypothetical protein